MGRARQRRARDVAAIRRDLRTSPGGSRRGRRPERGRRSRGYGAARAGASDRRAPARHRQVACATRPGRSPKGSGRSSTSRTSRAMLRRVNDEERHWRRVLEYCARGGLQAVLDEYAHVLVEHLGVSGRPVRQIEREVSTAMREALTLRTATVAADSVDVDEPGKNVNARREDALPHAVSPFATAAARRRRLRRSSGKATCRRRSTRRSGRSSCARRRSGRRGSTSTCTATP